jgi:mRNA-degrading endonuclease RelE of RelBE toxin-antitoxin system
LSYRIEYTNEAIRHLRALTARQRVIVIDAIDEQLIYEPTVETRNRKLMHPNPLAVWELRIGDLRVYYDVKSDPEATVVIRAVGIKLRNKVWIGGEEHGL